MNFIPWSIYSDPRVGGFEAEKSRGVFESLTGQKGIQKMDFQSLAGCV